MRPWGRSGAGPLLALAALLLVEAFTRGPAALPEPLSGALLVMSMGSIVAAAFLGGIRPALLSAGMFTLYAPRFIAPPGAVVERGPAALVAVLAMGAIAFTLAVVTGSLKHHADRLGRRTLEKERELVRDLARKNAELVSRREDAEEANRALAQANKALAQANETLGAFSYVVSHDLKEPVRALTTLTQILEEDHAAMLPEDGRELLRRTQEASRRLAALLGGLLEVSRAARTDRRDLHPVWIGEALNGVECTTRYRDLLRERGARLEVTVLHGTPPVLATTSVVCQVVGNLVVNAIKHNPKPAPLVRVRIHPLDAEGTLVETVVEDNGPGFSPAAMARLRDLLQGGTPRSLREGGFGLVIVQRAATHLGGRVWVDRSPEGGAAVHVVLPAASAEGLRQDAPARDRPLAPQGAPPLRAPMQD
jgi:signal transduction histidine kinase